MIGWALFDTVIFNNFFKGSITDSNTINSFYQVYIIHSSSFLAHSLTSLSFFALLLGLIISYMLYFKKNIILTNIFSKFRIFEKILLSEYGFSNLSNSFIPKNIKKASHLLWQKFDISIIDNFFINGSANVISVISSKIRLFQTGYIYHYAFTMIIGLLFFLIIFYDF